MSGASLVESGMKPLPTSFAPGRRFRRGQAMLETVFAVFFVTLIFLLVFQAAYAITSKILLDHAAARAARARAVGFNDWMCLKSARVAMIPVAGKRTWPEESLANESALIPIYMSTEDRSMANGVLEYERWEGMDFSLKSGAGAEVESALSIDIPRFYSMGDRDSDTLEITGGAKIESHFPLYMNDQGL